MTVVRYKIRYVMINITFSSLIYPVSLFRSGIICNNWIKPSFN